MRDWKERCPNPLSYVQPKSHSYTGLGLGCIARAGCGWRWRCIYLLQARDLVSALLSWNFHILLQRGEEGWLEGPPKTEIALRAPLERELCGQASWWEDRPMPGSLEKYLQPGLRRIHGRPQVALCWGYWVAKQLGFPARVLSLARVPRIHRLW